MKWIYAVCLAVVLSIAIICYSVNLYYKRWVDSGYSQVPNMIVSGYHWEKKL